MFLIVVGWLILVGGDGFVTMVGCGGGFVIVVGYGGVSCGGFVIVVGYGGVSCGGGGSELGGMTMVFF